MPPKNLYKIYFVNPDVENMEIYARNPNKAKILAQAEMIKQGKSYKVERYETLKHWKESLT